MLFAPAVVAAVALTLRQRPRIARQPCRLVDVALIACVAAVAVQLIPLPPAIAGRVSPALSGLRAALLLDVWLGGTGAWAPLTIDPAATADVLIAGATIVLLFWCARSLSTTGVRVFARGIAWTAVALTTVALVQHATAPRLIYWLWTPPDRGAFPYGPFVNRNHFASWLVMATPLTLGYAVAHMESHRVPGVGFDLRSTFDAGTVWLGAAAALGAAGVFASLSRSGAIALVAGLAVVVAVSGRRMASGGRRRVLAAAALIVVVATAYFNVGALAVRLDETMREGLGGRAEIWRETWPIVRDFWRTGVGCGGFERAMLVYQTAPRVTFFNHAHNEYLQLAADGGVLVLLPLVIAAAAAARAAAWRLAMDPTPMFWVRAGALGGLVAVAVQGIWEVPLLLPGNAVLFAILGGIALYEGGYTGPRGPAGSSAAPVQPITSRGTRPRRETP